MINNRRRMREEIVSTDSRSNREKYGVDEILAENEEWAVLPPVVEGMFKKFDKIEESARRPNRSRLHEGVSYNRRVREMGRYAMEPQFDSRKSFNHKAHVVTSDDDSRSIKCESYDTVVAEIKNGVVHFYPEWDCSATTLRHIKEFLYQNGFGHIVDTKAKMAKNPDIVFETESYEG